jgi:hypothetical protein
MTLPPERLRAVLEYRARRDRHGTREYVWKSTRHREREYAAEWSVTAEPSIMDHIIDWKLRYLTVEDKQLIRQFTIELRVNYADADKNEVMRKACAAAARHVFATANLLADGVKPDIAIFSDDWFAGKEEISLMQDVIQQGLDETSVAQNGEATVSSELMQAVMGGDSQ